MEESAILSQLNVIFAAVLKNKSINLAPTTTAADIDGWDSLTNMILISNIENHFSFKFKLKEVMKFRNVGDLVSCIKEKTK